MANRLVRLGLLFWVNFVYFALCFLLEEWMGQELTMCSLYGVRICYDGAVLAPHVDRLLLVSSAIIDMAQYVDEPWPIEVIAHNVLAYNVTMKLGEMVLYESHYVLHGRRTA